MYLLLLSLSESIQNCQRCIENNIVSYCNQQAKIWKLSGTYMAIFNTLQTAVMALSPCSLTILTILSTARKRKFHLVSFGLKSWSLQFSLIISAAVMDLALLFHRLRKCGVELELATKTSTVDNRFRRWQTQRWCLGSWYSRPLSWSNIVSASTNSTPSLFYPSP